MEVAELNSGTGVKKSSTAVSESSHEVSVEKTASGSIEQELSSKRSLEQSEIIQKSVQQSSQVVQESVTSSVSDPITAPVKDEQPTTTPQAQENYTKPPLPQHPLQTVESQPTAVQLPPQSQQQPQQQQNTSIPASEIKQESIKNTLKEIISDIDRVIEQDEEKSHIVMKSSTKETSNDDSGYITKSETYERREFKESSSAAGPKSINLQKLFTPATDVEEILPKNRKLYASSAFYSPNLHPTVEDQVELARRISHSLSDISNQQSKGQSMYVNRKKRSVKWVHEGEGKADIQEYNGYSEDTKENGFESKVSSSSVYHDKVPLKLVMNPLGQVRDFQSYQNDFNTQTGLLSPDKCAELVEALQAQKGKGAELFAKRRKKAENWIIDETTAATRSPSGVPYGLPKPTSPSILPAYSDVGTHRVQMNMQQDQIIQDKYATNQRLKLVKSPWEAALETGSPVNAFQEIGRPQQWNNYYAATQAQQHTTDQAYFPTSYESDQKSQLYSKSYSKPQQPFIPGGQRDLAYKPSVPQGWNAPPPNLPSELYTPPQIPLDSYTPPATEKYLPKTSGSLYSSSSAGIPQSSYISPSSAPYSPAPTVTQPTNFPKYQAEPPKTYNSFPITKPAYGSGGFSEGSNTNNYQQQKSTYSSSSAYNTSSSNKPISSAWSPQNDEIGLKAPSTSFNPSPLSYEKLAKFENPDPDDSYAVTTPPNFYRRQKTPVPSYGGGPSNVSFPPPANTFQTVKKAATAAAPLSSSSQSGNHFYADDLYSQPSSSRVSSVDLSGCQNYNTAARGWNQMRDYYRPITFGSNTPAPTKQTVSLPYSDF